MGLLDSVMGAVGGQSQGGEGLQGLLGMLGNQPQLMQIASSLLADDGAHGGLQGLIAKLQQGGLGDAVASWVGTGANQAITGEQLSSALGSDAVAGLASKFGLDSGELAGQLSSVLPGLVDKLTPNGQAPAAGLGNGGDLMGLLGGLLKG
jgi:uncharacterized protein YidB (DUF937 family)